MQKNDLLRYAAIAAVGAAGGLVSTPLVMSTYSGTDDTSLGVTKHAHIPHISKTPDEDRVVSAVENANPAVVAISISREVPVYEQTMQNYDPFSGLFGGDNSSGFTLRLPSQKQVGTEKREIGGGSGFLVSSDGYIMTNKHVVASTEDEYTVIMNDGLKYPAKVIARDPLLDLAVVKIEKTGAFPFLTFDDSSKVKLGQSVIVIGNALAEFRNTVTTGIVSGLSRSIDAGGAGLFEGSEHLDQLMQTDAAVNPGNSGGPILDSSGRVIGIAVATAGGASNISFAVLGNSAKNDFDTIKKNGKISRPYLGVRFIPVDDEVKKKYHLNVDHGALVQKGDLKSEVAVVPGSPAAKAGIVENDIILEIDGVPVDSDHLLSDAVRDREVGDTVNLKILRKGKEEMVPIVLDELKSN